MKLEDIYTFFRQPPPVYLSKEVAVCYVLYTLVEKGDSYGTALIQAIENEYPLYRLSDTVLYSALKFLEDEELLMVIGRRWKVVVGRGGCTTLWAKRSNRRGNFQSFGCAICRNIPTVRNNLRIELAQAIAHGLNILPR